MVGCGIVGQLDGLIDWIVRELEGWIVDSWQLDDWIVDKVDGWMVVLQLYV